MAASIEFVQLCGAATYRDGLFSILEAGISRFDALELPARPPLTVVAEFSFTEPDTNRRHRATVEVLTETGGTVVSTTSEINPQRPPDADLAVPFVHVLIQRVLLELEDEGLYTIKVSLDDHESRQRRFRVRRAEPA